MVRYLKKMMGLLLSVSLAVAIAAVPVGAVEERSSLYLSCYRAWLTPEPGAKIDVTIDVQAVDYMDDVGAIRVVIWESSDGGDNWELVRVYSSSLNPGMMTHDDYLYYDTPISYQGVAGRQYYSVVTAYAGDTTGSDSKTYVTHTVTAIS